MWSLPVLAIAFAALESVGLWKNWRGLSYLAKPAVIICLFLWLYLVTGLHGATFWFGTGLFFSLIGDVLLLWRDRFFAFGLAAFFLVHLSYLTGFNTPLQPFSLWSLALAVIVGLGAVRVLRQLLAGLHRKREMRWRVPVIVYGLVLTLMLLSALLTLSNINWNAFASVSVSLGAFLFFLSDVILGWNKFVTPISNGRLLNIALYHVGQILLIAGVVMQFS